MTSVYRYLGQLPENRLSPSDARRTFEIMHYAGNLERAGDVIKLSLADRGPEQDQQDVEFSATQSRGDCKPVRDHHCFAAAGSIRHRLARELDAARRLAAQKDWFRKIEDQTVDDHLGDHKGTRRSPRTTALFIDIVRDLHRINSHVAAAGYPLLQAAGLFRESRIRTNNGLS